MRKVLSTLAVLGVLGGFLYMLDLDWALFFKGDPVEAAEALREKVELVGLWKYPLFLLLFTLPPLLMVPMTLLSLVTALLFEGYEGFFLLMGGFLSNTVFSFWLARSLGQEVVEKYLMKGSGFLKRLDLDSENWGIAVVMLWRFLPVPYAWPAMAAGLSRMSLFTMLAGTAIISVFWSWFYVSFSKAIMKGDASNGLLAIGILSVLITAGWLFKRGHTEKEEELTEVVPFPLKPQEPARGPVLQMLSIPGDRPCDEARGELVDLCQSLGFEIDESDVSKDEALMARYGDQVPVVLMDGVQMFSFQVDDYILKIRLKEKSEGRVWTGGNTWDGKAEIPLD